MKKEGLEAASQESPEELFSSMSGKRVKEAESLNRRLRDHILLRDSAQRALLEEFKRQIAEKDSMIAQLTGELDKEAESSADKDSLRQRIAALEGENRKLASKGRLLESGLELMRHAKEKDSHSRVHALSARVAELERLNSELQQHADSLNERLAMQPQRKSDIALLGLMKRVKELEALNGKLRDHILLRDSAQRALVEEYKQQMAHKDEALKKIESSQLQSDSSRLSENSALFASGLQKAQQATSILKSQLESKEAETEKLKQSHELKEKSYEALCSQLSGQIKERSFEVERLKAFISQREALYQSVEAELERENARKDALLKKYEVSRPAEHVLELERQVGHSRQVITLKEAAAKRAFLDSVRLRERNSALETELREIKSAHDTSKQDYERLLSSLKAESDRSIKGLISDYSGREASLRAETEKLKSEISRKQFELGEQSRKIDSAITEFKARSDQIIQLRPVTETTIHAVQEPSASEPPKKLSHIQTEEQLNEYAKKARALRESLFKKDRELITREAEMKRKEEHLNLKESELNTMLGVVERRFAELQQREETLSRQEKILLKQQEAFNKELASFTPSSPSSPGKTGMTITAITAAEALPIQVTAAEPEVKQKPKTTGKPTTTQRAIEPVQQPKRAVPEKPSEKPAASQQGPLLMEELETSVQKIIPIKASGQKVVPAPKAEQQHEIDLASQSIGYSEIDEIVSMVDVAMQHKTTAEQIKKSLAASGYSKESIDKAFKKIGI